MIQKKTTFFFPARQKSPPRKPHSLLLVENQQLARRERAHGRVAHGAVAVFARVQQPAQYIVCGAAG